MPGYNLFLLVLLAGAHAQYYYPQPPIPFPLPTTTAPPPPPPTTTTAPPPPLEYLPPIQPDPSNEDNVIIAPPASPKPEPEPVVEEAHDHHHHHHDVPFWDFRESIPGEPEADYPILDKIPATSFSCAGRLDGYYADLEARCQVFHVCSLLPDGVPMQSSFLCPNGTIFNQESFACQWWADVACEKNPQFYYLNANIGVVPIKLEADHE